jgi:hypothetical protein
MNVIKLTFGMLVGLLLLPAALIVKIVWWPFSYFYKGLNMSAETLADYLRNELYDLKDDRFRWDVLENCKLRDPELDSIRRQAIALKWPLNSVDRQRLEGWIRQLSPQSS